MRTWILGFFLFGLNAGLMSSPLLATETGHACDFPGVLQHLTEKTSLISDSVYDQLFAKQRQSWIPLDSPLVIRTPQGTFRANYYVDNASSLILADTVNRKIVKIASEDSMQTYETLVTEYLRSQGEMVPQLYFSGKRTLRNIPHNLNLSPGSYFVNVRDYYEGLTSRDLDTYYGMDYFKSPLFEALGTEMSRLKRTYFPNAYTGFGEWLKKYHPNVQAQMRLTGDIRIPNFLYIKGRGWTLNDP